MEESIAEKRESVAMWAQIEEIARQITFPDRSTRDFVVTSCSYGRLKHAVVTAAWELLLLSKAGDQSGDYDKSRMRRTIAAYDDLWKQWKNLESTQLSCSSIYHDYGYAGRPGVGAQVDKLRSLVQS
jgi:hypothetical protein